MTDEVSLQANNLAGHEIDDALAQSLPFLILRHRYHLVGHRKTVPSVKLAGEFLDVNALARVDIDSSGDLTFGFENEQRTSGKIITLATTEERARFLLRARLEQAMHRKLKLVTEFGTITDEEDIEIALLLASRGEAREFKGTIKVDVQELNVARARLMVKVALGLGHRVLGPEWAFGPGGMMLRSHLFPSRLDLNFGSLRGTIDADVPYPLPELFGISNDRHVMAVLPARKHTFALIALFGGECGTAVIDLGVDSRKHFNKALHSTEPVNCAFSIPLTAPGSRPLETQSIQDLSRFGSINDLLAESRGAAERQA